MECYENVRRRRKSDDFFSEIMWQTFKESLNMRAKHPSKKNLRKENDMQQVKFSSNTSVRKKTKINMQLLCILQDQQSRQ